MGISVPSSSAACSEHTPATMSYLRAAKHSVLGRKGKGEGKVEVQLLPGTSRAVSEERPRSLADLKAYKDTKVLVARFLEHSSCSLPPEVQQVVNSIKFVIKSDERHMEEAIFSASVIDQAMTRSQRASGSPRKRAHEDLHLQSCGALSSPATSLHHVGAPPSEPPCRPVSVCRETIL